MLPELSIVKLLCSSTEFEQHGATLDASMLPKELQGVYRVLESHHRTNPGVSITTDDVANLFFASNTKDRDYYIALFDNLRTLEVGDASTKALIHSLKYNKLLRDLSLTAYEVAEGKAQKEQLEKLLAGLKDPDPNDADDDDIEFVTTDLDALIHKTYAAVGLRWRLTALNRILGSLRKGNFGFVFARPETGKTTFLASEVTFMVEQLKEEQGPAIWFNNEEVGENVMLRAYQASSGATTMEIIRDPKKYHKLFLERTKGKLLMIDRAAITKQFVERVCKKYKPSLVIFDQIDKIQGFAEDREDLKLGSIYQWARELAKEYCPVIGVCQADGTGEGIKWLTMGHVANAKTAKQAEADWILGIGKTHQMGFENIRYLNVSKNKLIGDEDSDPTARHAQREVIIEPDIARYRDLN